jgi:hypothetical protein
MLNEYSDKDLLRIAKEALARIPEGSNQCDDRNRRELVVLISWLETKTANPTP